jgi:hypothetical protein
MRQRCGASSRAREAFSRYKHAGGRQRIGQGRVAGDFPIGAPTAVTLVVSPYVIEEVLRNIVDLPPSAGTDWARLRPALVLADDVLTLDRAAVFPVHKDRPVLFSALAWADVLLTRDTADFSRLLGRSFYGNAGAHTRRLSAARTRCRAARVGRPRLNCGPIRLCVFTRPER